MFDYLMLLEEARKTCLYRNLCSMYYNICDTMPTVITLTNCCYNAIEIEKCIVHSIMKDCDVGELVNNWGGTDTKRSA